MRESTRQAAQHFLDLISRRLIWCIGIILAVIAAIAEPFDFFPLYSVQMRFTIWMVVISVGIVIAYLVRAFIRTAKPDMAETREAMAVSAILALLYGPALFLAADAFHFTKVADQVDYFGALSIIFGTSLMVATIRTAIEETPKTAPIPVQDRLFARLEGATDAAIERVSSSNHHVIVHLADGTVHKLRMRLSDAVKDIDIEPGFCIHRSHWVALRAINHVTVADGKEVVALSDGQALPIGPKYRFNLVEAGFLSA